VCGTAHLPNAAGSKNFVACLGMRRQAEEQLIVLFRFQQFLGPPDKNAAHIRRE
jgi:hypothetical protein